MTTETVEEFTEEQVYVEGTRVIGGPLGEENKIFDDFGDVVGAPFGQGQHFAGGPGEHLLKTHLNSPVEGA